MNKLIWILFSLTYHQMCLSYISSNDTELILAFLVHRHGDRTPLRDRAMFCDDREKLQKLMEPYGYGRVTNAGLNRSYELGKFIRKRYNQLLSARYKEQEMAVRTTDFPRIQMSALAVMAAVYPPTEPSWRPDLHWTPTPYTTIPTRFDPYLASKSCPKFIKAYEEKFNNIPYDMTQYEDMFEELAVIGHDFRKIPLRIFEAYDTYIGQLEVGLPLHPQIQRHLPRIQAAMETASHILNGDEEYIALQAGVLLRDFFIVADRAISGQSTPKVRVLSSHDFNVYSLMAVTKATPKPGWPKYGSMYALELRKVVATGEYVVLPVYLETPGEEVRYLQVEGCENAFCDFSEFKRLTAKYALSEAEWRKKCDFKEEDLIDIVY